ncbi:MAG TPA: hypothetical protein VL443_29245 [Cyclobacteriaceae bacterium]|jgi:hypothetical protein|nr:hypothetical protein [Cyclobacteriaceae bacterium]
MKYLTFIFILISLCACSQTKPIKKPDEQKTPETIAYVMNPNPTDSLCISDIERAKKEIKDGKIVFTQSAGFLFGNIRYEEELRKLCEEHGLVFDFDLIGCIVFEGQTQGCYGDYMDEIIKKKFGSKFKEQLHIHADSMFLLNVNSKNKTVQYWDCDERPRLPNENKRTSDYLPNITVSEIDINGSKGWPFFDLGFIVEKDSTVSNFYVGNFVAESNENKKYKDKLFAIAVQYIQSKYPTWIPGKIKGVPIRTDNNVRIFLTK